MRFIYNRISRNGRKMNISNRGLTLVELIVTIALSSIVILAVFAFLLFQLKVFNRGSDRSEVQNDLRLTSDFISNELKHATAVSISVPSTPSEFNLIYIDSVSKQLMYQPKGGTAQPKTGPFFDPTDLVFSVNSSGDSYVVNYSLQGNKNTTDYNISSAVILKNVASAPSETGNTIYYQTPGPVETLSTTSSTPTSTTSSTSTPTPTTTTEIQLSVSPSWPTQIINGTTTPTLTLTASGGNNSYSWSFSSNGWKTFSPGPESNNKTLTLTAPNNMGQPITMMFYITVTSGGMSKNFEFSTQKIN